MPRERLFLDTSFIQAVLNHRDQYYAVARALLPRVRAASQVWVTEAVLIEVGNALSAIKRRDAALFIERCYRTENMTVTSVDTALLKKALDLFQRRPDKEWGLTDCVSFMVMEEQGLSLAVTADEHFRQAGFRALLLE